LFDLEMDSVYYKPSTYTSLTHPFYVLFHRSLHRAWVPDLVAHTPVEAQAGGYLLRRDPALKSQPKHPVLIQRLPEVPLIQT
jgi:hypothetical protein